MTARWSPTDLSRQALVVRDIAARTLEDRRRVDRARRELAARLHGWLRSPALLAGCFAAGWLVGLAVSRPKIERTKRSEGRPALRQRLSTIGASLVWLMQQYKHGEQLAARLSSLRMSKRPQYAAESTASSLPIGT
jgi:hypothetical protein